jgi:hypothetical protein
MISKRAVLTLVSNCVKVSFSCGLIEATIVASRPSQKGCLGVLFILVNIYFPDEILNKNCEKKII